MSGEALLSVRGLSIDFVSESSRAELLRDVSLEVPQHKHVALVGESGCGKSVTARAVMGLLTSPPTQILQGEIRFDGVDVLKLRPGQRQALRGAGMSMVFQDPTSSLNPVFTIGDQMRTVLKYANARLGRAGGRAARDARVGEALAQVRIADAKRIAAAYPVQLSGGMRQRVLIAMALLSEPRLLIADEPGTALDVTTQAQILRLLQDLVEARGLALLMITHNLGVVRQSSDQVFVMYAGAVVEQGPTPEVFKAPRHPYTRALMACTPKLSGDSVMRGIDGGLPDYAAPPPGCRFAPRCPLAAPVCEQVPAHVSVSPGHTAACWRLEATA